MGWGSIEQESPRYTLFDLYDPAFDSCHDGLSSVLDTQFAESIPNMNFYGGFDDVELRGNFLVAEPFFQEGAIPRVRDWRVAMKFCLQDDGRYPVEYIVRPRGHGV